ncbi:MAG: PaREP1 family protein [Candidatus Methanomethylicia archaeon]
MSIQIVLPEKLFNKLREAGLDYEAYIFDIILKELKLDPMDELEVHLELAERFLEEGRQLIDKDPVQASEKLYKVAEETIKALAIHFKLTEILAKVNERGRWIASELDDVARIASKKLGEWFYDAWDHAWTLHVWGFHEAKLNIEGIKARYPYVERMVMEIKRIMKGN